MADMRILAAIRRFLSREAVQTAYSTIFTAYASRVADVTIITGKSTEGESAQAQIVVTREDMMDWMDALETILGEHETDSGENPPGGPVHVAHCNRYMET